MLATLAAAWLIAQSAPTPVSAPAAATAAAAPSTVTDYAAALTDGEVAARLSRIATVFDARERYADVWYYGFLSVFAGASAAQTGMAVLATDPNKRVDNIVGASTAFLGVIGMLITPVRTGVPARQLRAMPEDTPEQRRRKLANAETILRYDAAAETRARRWTEHATGALVSGGAFAILYWGYHLRTPAYMKLGSGVLFGQGRVLTTPQSARDGWDAYRSEHTPIITTPEPTWGIIPFLGGAALTVTF